MQGQAEDILIEERRKISLFLTAFVLLIVAMIVTTSWQSINEARALTEHHDAREIDNALARFKSDTAKFLASSDDWDDELLEADGVDPVSAGAEQGNPPSAHWHRVDSPGGRASARLQPVQPYQVRQVEGQATFDDLWLLDRDLRPHTRFSTGDATEHGHALLPLDLLSRRGALSAKTDPSVNFVRIGKDLRVVAIARIPDDSDFLIA